MMVKRKADGANLESKEESQPKRARSAGTSSDRLSNLSDELLLRILSNVSIEDVTVCQRVSHKLAHISNDSQLWRTFYYDKFVRPRFHQLPKSRRSPYPKKLAKWLDEGSLVKRGKATNWKRQYKIRHKWAKGTCDVNEIPLENRQPPPPLLARLHDGIVYTVDPIVGLRAWSYQGEQRLLATHTLSATEECKDRVPTAIAVDSLDGNLEYQRFVVGFENGSFDIFQYSKTFSKFGFLYSRPPSTHGGLTALAYASPYLLSMSENQTLSLYRWEDQDMLESRFKAPRLLISLKSHTVWPPLSLSLRLSNTRIVAAIAYAMPTFNSGWTAGVQELHLSTEGDIADSRLASALGQGFSAAGESTNPAPITSRPTSVSYSHPYLLVPHADNTLTLYIVNSSAASLTVSTGKRLWGHTSSVFGAHVGGRGKAVSVSTRGNEIRVWELEGTARPGLNQSEATSIQITPEKKKEKKQQSALEEISDALAKRGPGSCLPPNWAEDETYLDQTTRAYVGFDEESVVVLREHDGRQALAIYNFS